jgi:hypothetical protein
MTPITVKAALAQCVAFNLSGPAKLKADDLTVDQTVTVYEERSDGGYDPVLIGGVKLTIAKNRPSIVLEGYGNYKCLGSIDDLVVGLES